MFWTHKDHYLKDPFETASQLESAVADVSATMFGPRRIYLNARKLIGENGKTNDIPDGYLLDLSSKREPRMFVVENEVASHATLDLVAVRILELSLSFETSPFKLKAILKEALKADNAGLQLCETYAAANGFENLDYLLEGLFLKADAFNALVIIDDSEAELDTFLRRRFAFPVEILTLLRFKTLDGQAAYQFDPFQADFAGQSNETDTRAIGGTDEVGPSELDTVVVPAWEEGFQQTFMGENRWGEILVHSSMRPRIKYIAAYRAAPVSAITHVAAVSNIAIRGEGPKCALSFLAPMEIGPVKLVPKPNGTIKAPQAPRYTSHARLIKAANLDEAF
jgi:hypothetical protein